MRKEWEEAHTVTEELAEGPPTRRANATLTACPSGNHIWCIGGEFFSDDGKAYFYNDVFRYTPEKDEWRKFVSPTCPGPRSAHAVAATPTGGGKIFLFGGEFSSLHQNSFHHYRDFWCFDVSTHSWDRIDTKIRPSARSGHRMAVWKHYIVLFGGFFDPGITTRYLNDLWLFDTQEYKWRLVEFGATELRPSPRSGFSFLSSPDGVLLHGGYCKEYAKGKRPIGIMLEDTWFLNMSLNTVSETTAAKSKNVDPLILKWERRKRTSTSYAPSLRSGCTMALWASKNVGVLFGGVTDEDKHEETLESVFWNDLYGYQLSGKGKWISMVLRRPKNKSGSAKKKKNVSAPGYKPGDEHIEGFDNEDGKNLFPKNEAPKMGASMQNPEVDPDDPNLTAPLPRYNAMLSVLRNTLYIYGGIFERGSREYTLDDFYSLQLEKMDRYICLKPSGVIILDGDESSSDDSDDEDDDGYDDRDIEEEAMSEGSGSNSTGVEEVKAEEEVVKSGRDTTTNTIVQEMEAEKVPILRFLCPTLVNALFIQEELHLQAVAFMGVSKDTTRSPEDIISTPLPGETLAMFYARSKEFWSQKAYATDGSRGKQLRRAGFDLAQQHYVAYKPILKEVEKILAEAGLDEEEIRQGAAAGPAAPGGQSRNRR
ncbi:hypothetical protein BDZ94DRAFT_1216912 [Collybia nuda]|uniref:DUF4110 domain-containing protein n=1 Tax=Collybia nuda TaxID=64659 RepID=A0A9P6CFH7_9AGAR|nr:hypothetical protein BDZ94DRAFT_1216912 [Collybia nuda]